MINYLPVFGLTIAAFALSLLITPRIEKYMRSRGKIGIDVFKPNRPEVAEAGGIGFMGIFLIIIVIGVIIAPTQQIRNKLMMTFLILIFVVIIGLVDDFRGISARMKPFLLILAAVPVIFFREINDVMVASPYPVLPFVGQAQLTIAYWGLAIFVIAIPANTSNMLDVMNGVMSGSGILIMITAFLTTFILPVNGIFTESSIYYIRFISLTMTAVLIGFWWYNRYPASIFAGDTGSLGVGATIGLVAIYGQIEFIMVVALLVHIMNSFSIISSVGGLQERREIHQRPVKVDNGIIEASKHPDAPITMVRLLVAREATTEDKVIRQILFLVGYCCILALVSAFLIRLEVLV